MKLYWNSDSGARLGGTEMPTGRLFDANCLEWGSVTWCDTETGEIERFVRDENGAIRTSYGNAIREVIAVAAPLVFVPMETDQC